MENKHILLVEDESIIAIAEKANLEKYGYNVLTVNSGEKAVERMTGGGDAGSGIDLVLMDINLGRGIDGTEAARQIIAMRDIPVVFLSSHTEREVVEKTEGISSYGYVVKNSGITVLDAAIKMAFRLFEAKAREKEKEERFQALFNKAPLGYQSLNSDGNFIEVNWTWLETLGYKREEVIGKWFGDFLAPPYREAFRERFPLFKERGSIHSEFEMVRKNGEHVFIAFDGKIGFDGDGNFLQTHCILQDITGRKRNELSLKESNARHSAMIENIADVIAIIDAEGFNRYKSPNIQKWFGWRPEELVGRNTWEQVHPGDLEEMQSFFASLLEKEAASGSAECRYRCKDGSFKWISLTAVNLIHNPAIGGLLLNYRDISERKKSEEAIRKQLAEKEVLLKEVHHRIKNNIASVESLLFLQSQSVPDPSALSVLQKASGRVAGMRKLYEYLLMSDGYRDISVKMYLEDLIDTVLALFPLNIPVAVEKLIDDIYLDEHYMFPLGAIINELLTNIMKYAFAGRKTGSIQVFLNQTGRDFLPISMRRLHPDWG